MIALTMTAYDTAGAANRGAMASLLQLVAASHILFGTDFPPGDTSQEIARQLAQLGMFDQNALRAIDRENAVTLLPRLKQPPSSTHCSLVIPRVRPVAWWWAARCPSPHA